jgi:hypothetical protein
VADEIAVPGSTDGTLKRTYVILWPARIRRDVFEPRFAVGLDERTNASAAAAAVMVAADAETSSVPSMRRTTAEAPPALATAFTRTPFWFA